MKLDRLKWIVSGLDWDALTEWEQKFVESVEEQFDRNGKMSERQEEILERIYKDKGQR